MNPLLAKPIPLIDARRRIIVLWSAKSACTTTYVWFSGLCGFLQEVRDYQKWPHSHREQVFRKSARFKESAAGDVSGFHLVKIIRDPYARAVSGFRHAIRNGLIDSKALSFREYLLMLGKRDIATANIHFRPQFHPFEHERKPDTIINISKRDLFAELNALERRMRWPVTDFDAMVWLRELEDARRPPKLATKAKYCFARPIVRAKPPKSTAFPSDESFLTPAAKRLVRQIYRVDFEAYGADL